MLPRFAAVVAFIISALNIVSGLLGSVIAIPIALIPFFAGMGILRRRVWSAYGFAIYSFAPIVLVFLILLRSRSADAAKEAIVASVVSMCVGILFLLAGRSLAAADAQRGRAWPWVAVSSLFVLPFLFVEAFVNPTGSMEETLLVGDRMLVQRFPPPTPTRGDVMAFIYPIDRKQTFIKRIVGMPGDRIKLSHKVLYRNGAAASEPYAVHKMDYEDTYRDDFPSQANTRIYPAAKEMLMKNVVNSELVVPPGKYFVLGDNRDQSLDSRYWGFVSAGDFIGKPLLIYDSREQTAEEMSNHPTYGGHTRWGRLLRLL